MDDTVLSPAAPIPAAPPQNPHVDSPITAAAVALINRGLKLVLCDGKKPCFSEWQNRPPNVDLARIWLEMGKANAIGLLIGPENGIVDIETDSDDEERARVELFAGCDMPQAPSYASPRGRHNLYRWDGRMAATRKACVYFVAADGAKVGVRLGADGRGAQSIIPPSADRVWLPGLSLDECPPPPLPAVVIDRILAAAQHGAKTPVKGRRASARRHASDVHERALAAMLAVGIVAENDGSKRLFTASCRCVGHDLSDDEALATIRAYEREHPFSHAWTDNEILQRVRDAEERVTRGSEVVIENYEVIVIEEGGKKKKENVPLPMDDVIHDILRHTDHWPRRVDNVLFVDDEKHGLGWFDRRGAAGLMGWLRRRATVKWHDGGDYVSPTELLAEFERTAKRYDAIELAPHEPPVANVYYRCTTPPPGNGDALRALVDCFRPETPIDRDLILAMIATTFWGGPPGCRPAFVVTSDEGRGVGKSKLAELCARLAGGFLDVSSGEDIGVIKQRLLSPEGQTRRVAILDNAKTMRLSWAKLEALVTSPVISGKRLYVGEGQRPNLLTWIVTLNGVSLATDMAQRSIIVKLVKGDNSGPWYEETARYIDEHRQEIIGDVIAMLRGEPFPLAEFSRWAAWEQGVLMRLPEPGEAQRVILERQRASNCDLDEVELVEEFFGSRLASLGYRPAIDRIRIPSRVAAEWLGCAIGDRKLRTAPASRRLTQMHAEGQLQRLAPEAGRRHGRCYVWTGEAADRDATTDNSLLDRLAECASPLWGGQS